MKHLLSTTRRALLWVAAMSASATSLYAQSWTDFAHPDEPHVLLYDIPVSIPDLIDDPNDVTYLPVLVILLEFSDVEHQSFHTPAFFEDFTFGTGGGDWTSQWPSLKQRRVEKGCRSHTCSPSVL